MYRVKVKKACGGLKKKQEGGVSDEKTEINSSMGPVPREEANIEVEKGESAFGDINGDSFAELMFFGGKRHHSGGTPVNVPPGTFIFSDTPKMRIKDPELLEKFFNISNPKKKGYTPAEISKQYKGFNEYMDTLKDENADDMKVATAYEMVGNITNKLGALALIQESMKGFPDGIPSFAESAVAALGIDPQQLAAKMAPEQPQQPMQGEMPQQGLPEMGMGEMELGGSLGRFLPKREEGGEEGDDKKNTRAWGKNPYGTSYSGQGLVEGIEWGQLSRTQEETNQMLDQGYRDLMKVLENAYWEDSDTKVGKEGAALVWDAFLKAYETSDNKSEEEAKREIADAKDLLNNLNAEGLSWGWISGTDQNKFSDLETMLDQRVKNMDFQAKSKADMDLDQTAYDNFNKVKVLKEYISQNATDPITRSKYLSQIGDMEKKLAKGVRWTEELEPSALEPAYTPTTNYRFSDEYTNKTKYTVELNNIIDQINKDFGLNLQKAPTETDKSSDERAVQLQDTEGSIPLDFDNLESLMELIEGKKADTRQAVQPARNNQAQSDSTGTQGYDDYMSQFDFE